MDTGPDKPAERRRPGPRAAGPPPACQPGAPPSGQRPGGEGRPRGRQTRVNVWADGLDHAWCARCTRVIPPAFPVVARTGVATIKPVVVARRTDAVLVCDGLHLGPHCWPLLVAVTDEELALAMPPR